LGLGFRLQKIKKGGKHMFSFVVMSFVSNVEGNGWRFLENGTKGKGSKMVTSMDFIESQRKWHTIREIETKYKYFAFRVIFSQILRIEFGFSGWVFHFGPITFSLLGMVVIVVDYMYISTGFDFHWSGLALPKPTTFI